MTTPTPEFWILAGLPGSGKSTLSRHLKAARGVCVVSSDALRLAVNSGVYPRTDAGDYEFIDGIVWDLVRTAVRRLLLLGRPAAIDATNLTRARRREWIEFARSVRPGLPVVVCWCAGNWDSPERWQTERGVSPDEYRRIRAKLEASVELPTVDEADRLTTREAEMSSAAPRTPE